MKMGVRPVLIAVALLLIAGLTVFVAACGTANTTTTSAAAASTDTTAARATDSAVAATDTTAASGDSSTATGQSGTIQVKGLVDGPSTITADSLKRLGTVTETEDHPKLGPTEYTGLKLSVLFPTLKIQASATMVDFFCTDGYIAEVSLADVKASADSMLAIDKDGSLDAVMPGMYGKALARDIITMEFK